MDRLILEVKNKMKEDGLTIKQTAEKIGFQRTVLGELLRKNKNNNNNHLELRSIEKIKKYLGKNISDKIFNSMLDEIEPNNYCKFGEILDKIRRFRCYHRIKLYKIVPGSRYSKIEKGIVKYFKYEDISKLCGEFDIDINYIKERFDLKSEKKPMNVYETIGGLLRKRRISMGLSTKDVGEKLSLASVTILYLEIGNINYFSKKLLFSMCEYYKPGWYSDIVKYYNLEERTTRKNTIVLREREIPKEIPEESSFTKEVSKILQTKNMENTMQVFNTFRKIAANYCPKTLEEFEDKLIEVAPELKALNIDISLNEDECNKIDNLLVVEINSPKDEIKDSLTEKDISEIIKMWGEKSKSEILTLFNVSEKYLDVVVNKIREVSNDLCPKTLDEIVMGGINLYKKQAII